MLWKLRMWSSMPWRMHVLKEGDILVEQLGPHLRLPLLRKSMPAADTEASPERWSPSALTKLENSLAHVSPKDG